MTNTTPQARRVMAVGGDWGLNMGITHPKYGAGTIVGTAPLMVSFANTGQYHHANKEGEDCTALMLPDLNDPATRAVLEAQAVARIQALFPGYSVRITRIHEGDETFVDWCISSSQHSEPLLAVTALEIRALVYVFEWLASLEATNAQD